MTPAEQLEALSQIEACASDPLYFIDHCCKIYEGNEDGGQWIPFALWPAQIAALDAYQRYRKVIALKARQIGFSWLALAIAIHEMVFKPEANILIFSRRDEEAVELLSVRLAGIYKRLPQAWDWPKIVEDSKHEFRLANGSRAKAFPTTGGRSYTGTLAIVDEADFVADLGALLDAVKPTVDHGGRLFLISTADKTKPASTFKKIYRAARENKSDWHAVFCPWTVRPERTKEWYETQRRDFLARDGTLDMLWQEYPETDGQALAAKTLDKRIAPAWLDACFKPAETVPEALQIERGVPAIPGLQVYALPFTSKLNVPRQYVASGDPAEGNPTSDDSATEVLDCETGEEVASLAGKFQPSVLAGFIAQLCGFYNGAPVMVERNNHGHAVIQSLQDHHPEVRLLTGHDGKVGWLSNSLGKSLLYDAEADAFRSGEVIVHNFETYVQLGSIEGSTLRAPEGEHDDKADAHALCIVGRKQAADPWIGIQGSAADGKNPMAAMPGGAVREGFASEIENLRM